VHLGKFQLIKGPNSLQIKIHQLGAFLHNYCRLINPWCHDFTHQGESSATQWRHVYTIGGLQSTREIKLFSLWSIIETFPRGGAWLFRGGAKILRGGAKWSQGEVPHTSTQNLVMNEILLFLKHGHQVHDVKCNPRIQLV
jgi:hypothetical protein